MKKYIRDFFRLIRFIVRHRHLLGQTDSLLFSTCEAHVFSSGYKDTFPGVDSSTSYSSQNRLREYFQNHRDGPGIWKWEHYFNIYDRHFSRFVGKRVNVLEIGIYSGGSLKMWQNYFGEESHIYGVDIEAACKAYESERISVFTGDQADRAFWKNFRENVEGIDILIDDGGHGLEQQQITLEEMLPYLRPGGIYLCEDIHGYFNPFSTFTANLVSALNNFERLPESLLQSNVSLFQQAIHSIHFYPYVVVIEKHDVRPTRFTAPKHGTEWQPFYKDSEK